MDIASGFDVHQNVRYHDITKLYFNKFPFKVLVKDPTPRPPWMLYHTDRAEWDRQKAEFDFRGRKFLNTLMRTCRDRSPYKWMDNQRTFSFFFSAEADATHFINKHRKHVTDVYRPPASAEITVLKNEPRGVMRAFLFEGSYRWKITFKRLNSAVDAQVDDWVSHYFAGEPERAFYKVTKKGRRLFLTDENDMLMTKMGCHDHIAIIEKAILRNEISNESATGSDAG